MQLSQRIRFAMGLVRAVAMHDEETAIHLRATAVLSRRIAAHMQLSADVTAIAEVAGLLHDIGKVAVGRQILRKPTELTLDEWDVMRDHAAQGASVLERTPLLADLAPVVRAHHERLDGRGYPDRLRGDEIPLEARVVAVADAFHALTTDRPYRAAVLPQAALHVLRGAAGTQFDSDVITATLDMFNITSMTRTLTA